SGAGRAISARHAGIPCRAPGWSVTGWPRAHHSLRPGSARVGAEPREDHEVVVAAGAELCAAGHAFAGEAGLLEGARLGEVVDVGRGLDAVGAGRREQPIGEDPLGLRTVALAAGTRRKLDAEHPRRGLRIRAVGDAVVLNGAKDRAVLAAFDEELGPLVIAQLAV